MNTDTKISSDNSEKFIFRQETALSTNLKKPIICKMWEINEIHPIGKSRCYKNSKSDTIYSIKRIKENNFVNLNDTKTIKWKFIKSANYSCGENNKLMLDFEIQTVEENWNKLNEFRGPTLTVLKSKTVSVIYFDE